MGGFWLVFYDFWVVFGWFGWFLVGLGGFWLVWVVFAGLGGFWLVSYFSSNGGKTQNVLLNQIVIVILTSADTSLLFT